MPKSVLWSTVFLATVESVTPSRRIPFATFPLLGRPEKLTRLPRRVMFEELFTTIPSPVVRVT
jgi:hypothetical protein